MFVYVVHLAFMILFGFTSMHVQVSKCLSSVFALMKRLTFQQSFENCYNKTIEFMFVGINMFWAELRLILAQAVRLGLKKFSE